MKKLFLLLSVLSFGFFSSCSENEEVVTIHTDKGDIVVILFDETPEHKANFLELVETKYYDGTTFHRTIDGFMIQGGDPNSKDYDLFNDGTGGPGYTVPAEFNSKLTHKKGAVAAARMPDSVNPEKASSGSQFFIVEPDEGYHSLDGNYTVFGQTISGLNVVEAIAIEPKDARDRPFSDIRMTMEVTKMNRKKIAKEFGYEFE